MKHTLTLIAVALLAGCTATKSVIVEYDAQGNVTKRTETSQSMVSEITASTKDKTVIAWESGWAAYISASMATAENPTPTGKLFAGKTDKGLISALPQQQDWEGMAKAINATKYELSVGFDGVGSTSAPAVAEGKTAAPAPTAAENKAETTPLP